MSCLLPETHEGSLCILRRGETCSRGAFSLLGPSERDCGTDCPAGKTKTGPASPASPGFAFRSNRDTSVTSVIASFASTRRSNSQPPWPRQPLPHPICIARPCELYPSMVVVEVVCLVWRANSRLQGLSQVPDSKGPVSGLAKLRPMRSVYHQ